MVNGSWSYLPWTDDTVEALYGVVGLVVAAGAVWLGIVRGWMSVVYISAGFFTLFLYIRLFKWWWDWLPSYVMFAVVGAIAIGAMYVLKRLRGMMEVAS